MHVTFDWYVVQQEIIKGLSPAPVKAAEVSLTQHLHRLFIFYTTLNPQICLTDWLICFRNLKR